MKIKDFSGGLNTRVAPSLLQPNEAQVYTNIDNSAGSIRPVKDKSDAEPWSDKNTADGGIFKYFTWYDYDQEWLSSPYEASAVEYRDRLYITQEGFAPSKWTGDRNYFMGITPPVSATNPVASPIYAALETPTTATYNYDLNTAGNLTADATYQYMYTYYDSVSVVESAPYPIPTEPLTLSSGSGQIRIAAHGSLEAFAFKLSAGETLTPVGGTWAVPTPTTAGWSDGIPAGTYTIDADGYFVSGGDFLHFTARWFTSDGLSPDTGHEWGPPVRGKNEANLVYTDDNGQPAATEGVEYQFATTAAPIEEDWLTVPSSSTLWVRVKRSNYSFETLTWSYTYGNQTLVSGEQGSVSNSINPNITHVKLYRIGGDLTEYRLVDTIAFTGTIDNADYTDNIADATIASADILNSTGQGGYLSGTYNYVYTYYNSVDGTESAPSQPSPDVVATNNKMRLDGIWGTADGQVTHIRIYRIGGTLTQYTLIAEVSAVADLVYYDNSPDINVAGNSILDSTGNSMPPADIKYFILAYAMIFGAVGDKLYYSNIGDPDVWPATNFIDFEDTITGIGNVGNGLLVFTKFRTYIVTGTSPATFSKFVLSDAQGCINHYTIQTVDNYIIWLSTDGICLTNGGLIEVISRDKLGRFNTDTSIAAAVKDNSYYLLLTDKIVVYDMRYNRMVREITSTFDGIGYYKDEIFVHSGTNLYALEDISADPLTYTYKSPVYTDGDYSSIKRYKDFYIKYNGAVTLKVYVDGTLKNTVALTGNTTHNLKASASSIGYGLEIELEGTAEVSEITWTIEGRQTND